MKYCLKRLIMPTVASNTSGVAARFMICCSAPNISGTSVCRTVPPIPVSRSETRPTSGLAVMPENASEPPHLTPSTRSETGHAVRSSCSAMATNSSTLSSPSSTSSPTSWEVK